MKRPLLFDSSRLSVSREYYEARRPIALGASIWVVLQLCAMAAVWSVFAEIEEVVRGPALVRPIAPISLVSNPAGGSIERIVVTSGTLVAKGELLYRIGADAAVAGRLALEAETADVSRRLSQLELLADLLDRPEADPSAEGIEPEIRHRLLEAKFRGQHYLLRIRQARTDLELEQQKPPEFTTPARLAELSEAVTLLQLEHATWMEGLWRGVWSERRTLQESLTVLGGRIAVLERGEDIFDVSAPIDGRIELLRPMNEGDWLSSGEAVARVIPETTDRSTIEIEISPGDIAEVVEGLPVRIQISSLPPSEFGFISATVTRVAADAIIEAGGRLHFLVEAETVGSVVSKYTGTRVALHPGMAGEARIIRRTKPAILYILDLLDFRH